MPRTLGISSSSTPLGKKVYTSRCSFYIFLCNLDKGFPSGTFPDSRGFLRASRILYFIESQIKSFIQLLNLFTSELGIYIL